jgi:CDP-diacylglycerol---glycerol-3-phosphate 3-phosphatidyltransferase
LQTISTFSYKLLLSLPSSPTPYTYQHEDYVLSWPDPQTHPHEIHQKAQTALSGFQLSHCASVTDDFGATSSRSLVESDSILIFPIIQAGQFNIREEETVIALLFRLLDSKMSKAAARTRPLVDLTSGYFGLYQSYQEHILASDVETRILVAGPKVDHDHELLQSLIELTLFCQANGFYGSAGISGRIPEGYTLLEQRFMKAVAQAGRRWNPSANGSSGRGVQLSEWEKDGWTYHAKGRLLLYVYLIQYMTSVCLQASGSPLIPHHHRS